MASGSVQTFCAVRVLSTQTHTETHRQTDLGTCDVCSSIQHRAVLARDAGLQNIKVRILLSVYATENWIATYRYPNCKMIVSLHFAKLRPRRYNTAEVVYIGRRTTFSTPKKILRSKEIVSIHLHDAFTCICVVTFCYSVIELKRLRRLQCDQKPRKRRSPELQHNYCCFERNSRPLYSAERSYFPIFFPNINSICSVIL